MGNVIMKAQQIAYGASNIEKALDDLSVPELIELNKRMDAIDAWKANVHEETYTGSELTIENALALPARSLKTAINAIQDLHGYDKPWVGGAYKNKLPMTVASIKAANTSGTWTGNVYAINNVTVEILTDSANNVTGFKVNTGSGGASNLTVFAMSTNISLASGDYKFNGCSDGSSDTYFINLRKAPSIDIRCYTGDTDFTYSESFTAANIVILSGVSLASKIIQPMIRLATETDASFAPYSNICPISGRTDTTVTVSDGDEISEDFTIQLGQTVYGADINWDTGVMTVLDAIVDMGNLTYQYDSGTNSMTSTISGAKPPANDSTPFSAISSICPIIAANERTTVTGIRAYVFGGYTTIYIRDSGYTDPTAFKTAMTGQTVCYKLATPLELTLTPTEVQMLKGYNRVTIDNGSIELKALVLGGDN